MVRILIIDGHPSTDPNHYVPALARSHRAGSEEAHQVRQIVLSEMEGAFVREPRIWNEQEPEEGIVSAQQDIAWAEHLVTICLHWLGNVPSLLKACLQQVSRPGFAVKVLANGRWQKLLTGESVRVICTMVMPAPLYRLSFRAHSAKSLKRNVLHFVGIKPVRTTIIGHVDKGYAYRKRWLKHLERLGRFAR